MTHLHNTSFVLNGSPWLLDIQLQEHTASYLSLHSSEHATVWHITSVPLDTPMILGPTAKLPSNSKHVYIIFTLTYCTANIIHIMKTVNIF